MPNKGDVSAFLTISRWLNVALGGDRRLTRSAQLGVWAALDARAPGLEYRAIEALWLLAAGQWHHCADAITEPVLNTLLPADAAQVRAWRHGFLPAVTAAGFRTEFNV